MGAASRRTSGGCSGYAAIDSINPVPSVLAAFLALAATTVAAANDGLASMRAAGVMRWGCDISGGAPFAFPDPSDPDRVIGFEVEIAEHHPGALGDEHFGDGVAEALGSPGDDRGPTCQQRHASDRI